MVTIEAFTGMRLIGCYEVSDNVVKYTILAGIFGCREEMELLLLEKEEVRFSLCFTSILLLLCTLCSASPASFVFGDSLVDIGNNNYLPLSLAKANLYPNGIDYGTGIATGRFSNGRTVTDIICMRL